MRAAGPARGDETAARLSAERGGVIDVRLRHRPRGRLGRGGPQRRLRQMLAWFAVGDVEQFSDETPFARYAAEFARVPSLIELWATRGETAAERDQNAASL